MKLLIHAGRVVATATDDYIGPDNAVQAPEDFDINLLGQYHYENGVLFIPVFTQLTRRAFRARMTMEEKMEIDMASLDDPSASSAERRMAATLRTYLSDLSSASYVDLADQAVANGLQMLEAVGLLAEGRALAILDAPVQASERPTGEIAQ